MNNNFIAYKFFCHVNGVAEGNYKYFKKFMEVNKNGKN